MHGEWGGGAERGNARAGKRARAAGAYGVGGVPRGRGLQVNGRAPGGRRLGEARRPAHRGKVPVSLMPSSSRPPSRAAAAEPSPLH